MRSTDRRCCSAWSGSRWLAIRESFGAFDVARYARRVVEQEAQFRNLVAGSNDVIMVLDGELVVRWQSPAAARQFGLSDQDVVGRHFLSMIQPADASAAAERLSCSLLARAASTRPVVVEVDPVVAKVRANVPAAVERPYLIEARLRDGFGRWRETESSVSDQRHVPEVGGLVLHIRDVGERKEMERTVHRLAYADELTGLANRRQLLRTIGSLRSVALVNGAMLLVELDGFTAVNDVRGYDIGDAVLVEVARRLRTGSGGADLAARLSGDEFAIVTESSPVRAYALATRLVTMLAEPVVLPGATVHLTASVGMTDLAGGENSEDVLRRADLALRRAKQLGRGRVEWYDAAVEEQLLRRMTLEQELPGALDRGELDLIYQPILDLVAGRPLARRGAAAMAAPAAGHAATGRRDPGGRGPRPDREDRQLGALPGDPAVVDLAARGAGPVGGGQRLTAPVRRRTDPTRSPVRSAAAGCRPSDWCWSWPSGASPTTPTRWPGAWVSSAAGASGPPWTTSVRPRSR